MFPRCDLQDSRDLYSECLRTFWSCPNCDLYMPLTPLERMQHEASCRPAEEQQQQEEGQESLVFILKLISANFKHVRQLTRCLRDQFGTNSEYVLWFSESKGVKAGSSSSSSLSRVYHCDVCNEDLTLTSTEILKHKRQHMYSAK